MRESIVGSFPICHKEWRRRQEMQRWIHLFPLQASLLIPWELQLRPHTRMAERKKSACVAGAYHRAETQWGNHKCLLLLEYNCYTRFGMLSSCSHLWPPPWAPPFTQHTPAPWRYIGPAFPFRSLIPAVPWPQKLCLHVVTGFVLSGFSSNITALENLFFI